MKNVSKTIVMTAGIIAGISANAFAKEVAAENKVPASINGDETNTLKQNDKKSVINAIVEQMIVKRMTDICDKGTGRCK